MTVATLYPEAKEYATRIALPLMAEDALTKAEKAYRFVQAIEADASLGEPEALAAMSAFNLNGAAEFLTQVQKSDRGTVLVARTGAVLSMPTRFGVRRRNEQGIRQKGYQQPLWWELSWAQFGELIASLDRQSARLGFEAEAFRGVLTLRDKYPDSKTPGEACQLAGIDPISFEATA